METEEVNRHKKNGYNPRSYYENNAELKEVIDFLATVSGGTFKEITDLLLNVDSYMALADYADYSKAQQRASRIYCDKDRFFKMSLNNIAASGIFAADRSIKDYAENIWHIKPIK
jgi:starch phosphorylase